ncbi:MAG: hypothetical protein PHW04_15255 [Candidatus Wallbacteria bacterium]|nr:hypothetical protein [Candidatus Wallbacteria bacterium]
MNRKALLIAALFVFCCGIVAATEEVKNDNGLQGLIDNLSLTGEVKTKVDTLIKDFNAKKEALKPEEVMAKRDSMEAEFDASLKAALAPDQYAQYTKLLEEKKMARQNEMAGKMMEKLIEKLTLTTDEVTAVTPLVQDMFKQRTELAGQRPGRDASDDVKKAFMDKMKGIQQQFEDKLKAAVTADQFKLFEDSKGELFGRGGDRKGRPEGK